jgi:Putative zinc-finger
MTTDLHVLLAPYVVDALGGAEREKFEEHLGECALCRSELPASRVAADRLGEATPPLRSID